jgi:hypothetical protein
MEFEYKQVKVPARAAKRLPSETSNPRAYKVRLKAGPGYDSSVLGLVIGTDMAGKPGWSTYYDSVLKNGFGSRRDAAVSMV